MIKKVTITGADNSIRPAALAAITDIYSFVEWGILVSRRGMGNARFPNMEWLQELALLKKEKPDMKLSLHLCGAYVRQLLMGHDEFIYEIGADVWNSFERVQINTHGEPHEFNPDTMIWLMNSIAGLGKEFIFQYDNANEHILQAAIGGGVNCSTLFDMSHGAGVLPGVWPLPLEGVKCGYAGGLSPDNLKAQMELIEAKAGETEIWIDCETWVRSGAGQCFCIDKVKRFLSIADEQMKTMIIPARGVVTLTQQEQDFANHVGYEVKLLEGGTGINLGLYFPDTWAEDGILKASGVNVFFPEKNKIYVQNFNQVELIFPNGVTRMNQAETLFGFTSWLTTREQPVTFSGKHDAAVAAELINIFSKINNLPKTRENWTDYLVGMMEHEEIKQQPDNANGCGMIHTKNTSRCLQIAKEDEPIFVLLARDETAQEVIVKWVAMNLSKQPFGKLYDALQVAEHMQVWKKRQEGQAK